LGIVTMKELLEAGVHFGHQTRRWDPHMKPFIFTERNGIHIIDLQKTIALLKIAYNAIKEVAKNNGTILFVGTKRQAQSAIIEEATRCSMPYVANRWLGGMLTNFSTIQKSITSLKKLERMEVDGSFDLMTKKEVIGLKREKEKLLRNIGGIKDLETLPDMVFIIDPKKEAIAVAEAIRVKVPIVAIVDTNCSPKGIDYIVPGNDDAIRAINLFAQIVSSSVIEGHNEAGEIEITEETRIISLADEEKAKSEREAASEEDEEGYISAENEGSIVNREEEEENAAVVSETLAVQASEGPVAEENKDQQKENAPEALVEEEKEEAHEAPQEEAPEAPQAEENEKDEE